MPGPLFNQKTIDTILRDEKFHRSHSAAAGYLGAGAVYYAMAYSLKAKVAVCLGSGSGFVPRLMRQAQVDCGISDESRTILVDANLPGAGWGAPDYHDGESFFLQHFDVELIAKTTRDALSDFVGVEIDYLHIDADHSYEWARHDLLEYGKLMSKRSVITMHDARVRSHGAGVWKVLEEVSGNGFEVVNLPIALGVAIVRTK